MDESTTLAAHIGERVRHFRKRSGWTQDQLAVRLSWQQSHVATLEGGKRSSLSLDDVTLLCAELGVTLVDLLEGDGQVVLARKGQRSAPATLAGVRHGLLGAPLPRGERVRGEVALHMMTTDVERKAARSIGVEPIQVTMAAVDRWGHSMASERERRLKTRAKPDASDRSLQGLRGHISRELLDELRPALEQR